MNTRIFEDSTGYCEDFGAGGEFEEVVGNRKVN